MDPYSFDLPELPTGEGDSDISLLPGIPFGPEDVGPAPEVRKAIPYTEPTVPFTDGPIEMPSLKFGGVDPVRSSFINLASPTTVDPPAVEDSLIKSWEAQDQAEKAAAEKAQIERIQAVNGPIFNERGYDPKNLIANTVWGGLVDQHYQEKFNKDYGWLGGQDFPKWDEYKKANYESNWDTLTAEQQQQAFGHWSNKAADFWIGYNGVKPAEYEKAFKEASQGQLAGEYKGFTTKQLKEDADWLDQNIPSTFSLALDEAVLDKEDDRINPDAQGVIGKAFTAKKANLLADKANAEMRGLLEAKNFVAQYGGVGEDGKISKESLEFARKSITDEFQFEMSDPDMTDLERVRAQKRFRKEIDPIETLLASDNPEAEITKWNEAYHRYRRMGQNLQTLQSPEIRTMLGSKTAGEFWSNVWDNKAGSMGYFMGEAGAQLAESAPYMVGGAIAAVGTGPVAPAIIAGSTGASGGIQEYRAIIPQLIEEEFARRGLDSKDSESWAKVMQDESFYTDVVGQATRKGAVTAVVESGLNAMFSHVLKLIPKSLPVRGNFGRTIGFVANRAAEVPAGVVAAGSGEVAGQAAQRPGQPINWVDVSQEILAEGPGQMQQTALESASSVYGKYFGKEKVTPTQTPTDAGTSTTQNAGTTQVGDLSVDSIEREVGQGSIPKSTQAAQENGPTVTTGDGTVPPPSGQSVAGQTTTPPEAVRSAKDAAEFFASLPAAKDAFESAQAIINAAEEPATPAVEAADVFQQAERQRQSLEGLAALNQNLRRLEFYSNLAPAPVVDLSIPQTSAEKSAQAIENQLGSEEQFRQSPEGRNALGKELQMFDTPDQPFTQSELNQLELNGLLSPEEKKQYIDFLTKKSVDKSRLAFNAGLAGRLIDRVVAEDRIRQSFGGMEALRKQYAELENSVSDLAKKVADNIGQESYGTQQKGKGMSVQESNRRNQGGFVDLDLAFKGVREAAVNAWAKTKDFGSWSTEMISVYGTKIKDSLSKIWNALLLSLSKTKDFLTYTGNKERGTIDLRQPRTDSRPSAGGPFRYSLAPYDPVANKIGRSPIAKSGIIPETEFLAINKEPVQLKKSELEFYKTIVPDAFKDGMVDVKKLYEGLRDNGPVVKVTIYGQDKNNDPAVAALGNNIDALRHEWLDNLQPTQYNEFAEAASWHDFSEEGAQGLRNDLEKRGWSNDDLDKAVRLFELRNEQRKALDKRNTLRATDYYDQISPFETSSHPVIRVDLTIPDRKTGRTWEQDNLHENMPNTFGWAMIQPVVNPLDGKPAWFVAELQSQWAQRKKKNQDLFQIREVKDSPGQFEVVVPESGYITNTKFNSKEEAKAFAKEASDRAIEDHPFLATHQKAVLNAVIDEAKKAGIQTVIVSDAETAMMTEMHDKQAMSRRRVDIDELNQKYPLDRFSENKEGKLIWVAPEENDLTRVAQMIRSNTGSVVGSLSDIAGIPKLRILNSYPQVRDEVIAIFGNDRPSFKLDSLRLEMQRPNQEKGMRVAYDTTLPSIMKEVTGRVGIPVDLGKHKNNQSVYSFEGDYKGEGSNVFTNPDGTPKSTVTGKAYDITTAGPKSAMLFADVFGVKLVADSVRIAFRGTKELAGFTAQIVKELGQWIQPYAQRLWDTMQKAPATLEKVVNEIAAEAAPRQTGRILASNIRKMFASEPKNSPLLKSLKKINFQYLPYTERKEIAKLSADYFAAKKGKGPIVKADLLQLALDSAAKLSYERAFVAAKKNFPISLNGKVPSDFTSEADINGYVASLHNAESDQLAARNKARAAGLETRKANRAEKAQIAFEDAKGQATLALSSDLIKNLSPRMQAYAKKALESIMKIDPTNMTPAEKEQVTAAMQNVANGNFIGLGAILARAEAVGAMVEGTALKKKNGSLLGIPLSGKFGRTIDFFSAGALPQSFARHDTRERVTFMTPDAKDWWSKHISKFGNEGLRIAHELQLENVRKIEGIIKKYGFSEKGVAGIFRKTKINSAKRMGIVALLSQYRDVENPNADLNMQLNNLIKGIQAMQQDKSSIYKAIGQVEGSLLRDFLVKAVKEGLIAKDDEGKMEIAVAPEEWTAFLFDQLNPQEQGALQEIWDAAGQYTNDIGFVQEFVYGKEWQPWNNYVMQQAMTLDGKESTSPEGMQLDASTLANSEFNTPVGKTQSILNPRVGLAKGQFYNLDIFHTAISGMNQAAYEIGTAQPRMELKALFEDPLSTDLFDSAESKKNTYLIYKDIHQKSLGIETGTSIQGSPNQQLAAYALVRPLTAWTGLIMNSIIQPLKQGIAPVVAYAIADGALGHMLDMWQYMGGSEAWTKEAQKEWIKQATPALLTRIETYDPAYDDLVGSGIVEEVRRLAKDHSFVPLTAEQKRLKLVGFILNSLDPIAEIPINISRHVNTRPDAFAARHIFFSEYTRYLLKAGVIQSIEQFTPSLVFHENAATHAEQIVTETLGGAGSREKRPNVLSYTKSFGPAGRAPVLLLRGMLMHLAGIQTQMSSDTFRSLGEAFYSDPKNPEQAKQVRADAQLRIRRNVIQNATFVAIGYASAYVLQNALIFGVAGVTGGFGDAEGLDDEEKEILRRLEQARYDAQLGPVGAVKATRDIGMLFTGGMSTNNIGNYAFDKGMSFVFSEFFKEDYQKKIKEYEALIKKTTDKDQKKKIQDELDTAKSVYRNLTYQGTLGIDHGLIDGYQDIAGFIHGKVDNAEADRIAMEYYEKTKGKPGAMKESPERSGVQTVVRAALDKIVRLASSDFGTAQDRINKARKIVMEKRKSKLYKEDGTPRPNPQPIDVQFGSLTQ